MVRPQKPVTKLATKEGDMTISIRHTLRGHTRRAPISAAMYSGGKGAYKAQRS
jgi:hypothetical protein